jgi:hypothetical protein
VTGAILNTSGINIGKTGTLELAKNSGSATAANLEIVNNGWVRISVGSQTVGTISGTGSTQVAAGSTLTAFSIVQDKLTIGGSAAGVAGMAEVSTINQVPEPGTIALMFLGVLGMIVFARHTTKSM